MKTAVVHSRFWHNKKVLLTGHTGFKGSWLSLWLVDLGAKVTGVALPPLTKPSLYEVGRVSQVLERSIMLDIRDAKKLDRVIQQVKPEIIIHMAAQPLVLESYKDPVGTYATNVMGTINLLESVRRTPGVRAVVNVTTDKCYENLEHRKGYREGDPLGGHDPYSSSKACSEIVTAAYRKSFFNPAEYKKHGVAVATARAGNVIGGGDWSLDRLIPDGIRALVKGQDIPVRNPASIRPWQHVLEPLSGYLILAEKLVKEGPVFSSAWNFGPAHQDVWTVKQVAEMLCEAWGGPSRVKLSSGRHLHEAKLLMLDITKARRGLGWRPQLSVKEALGLTLDWYKDWHRKMDMQAVSLQQIRDFQIRAGK